MGKRHGRRVCIVKRRKEKEGLDFVYIMCVDVTKSNKIIRPVVKAFSFVLPLSKRDHFLMMRRKRKSTRIMLKLQSNCIYIIKTHKTSFLFTCSSSSSKLLHLRAPDQFHAFLHDIAGSKALI